MFVIVAYIFFAGNTYLTSKIRYGNMHVDYGIQAPIIFLVTIGVIGLRLCPIMNKYPIYTDMREHIPWVGFISFFIAFCIVLFLAGMCYALSLPATVFILIDACILIEITLFHKSKSASA